MILAAGLGTRLKPITNNIPKALVEVNGKTLLQFHIERIIEFGITDIVVNVHHFSEKVIEFLESKHFDANIIISNEYDLLLDTGGAIRKAYEWLAGDELVLIQNVDIYSNIDYEKMLEQHNLSKALATIAVRARPTTRYLLFNENDELCGWQNTKTGEEIITRSNDKRKQFGFSCVHIISQELLDMLPNENVFSIISTYLELSKHNSIKPYIHNSDYWFDIGTPEKLSYLERFLKNN